MVIPATATASYTMSVIHGLAFYLGTFMVRSYFRNATYEQYLGLMREWVREDGVTNRIIMNRSEKFFDSIDYMDDVSPAGRLVIIAITQMNAKLK